MQNTICYIPICGDLDDLSFEKIISILKTNFTNVAIFSPIMSKKSGEFFSYSNYEAKEILAKNPDAFWKKIITQHDELCQNYDFVLVCGVNFGSKFNYELAKNLNAPAILQSDLKLHENECKECGVEFLAQIYNGEILSENRSEFNLINAIKSAKFKTITPFRFECELYKKAAKSRKTIVLPEGFDERILRAADAILQSKVIDLIILGKQDEILRNATNLGLNLDGAKFINPEKNEYLDDFATTLYELRKSKGVDLQTAQNLVRDISYFGTMLVYRGIADGMVSGASTTTAQTIRPALQIIKTSPSVSVVSGSFFICLDTSVMLFADCAITPNPTPEQLAQIALSSALCARSFDMEPCVAMLSYSTGQSGSGESVEATKEATNLAKNLGGFSVDGPMQFDAAIDEIVARKKMPNSPVAGKANVFIFPDLNCGNIAYKAVQRTAGALAVGPILQGLKKPINDLSRGCLVKDIINTILITAIQAGANE